MARSDSSGACASALWLGAFADRPRSHLRSRRSRGLPVLVHVVSQRARVLDYAGPTAHSRLLRNSRVAFLHQERVGVLVLRFSKLNSPAHRYPVYASSGISRCHLQD